MNEFVAVQLNSGL